MVIITLLLVVRIYNVNFKPEMSPSNIIPSITQEEQLTFDSVKVRYVVDGDTIAVTYPDGKEEKVRLIGCNTPESVSSDKNKNCEEGKKASEYTKSLVLPGDTVYLQYDKEHYDKYERVLAYVWLSKPEGNISEDMMRKDLLNAKLLLEGQANTLFIAPNIQYKNEFLKFEKEAKNAERGFWENGNFDSH